MRTAFALVLTICTAASAQVPCGDCNGDTTVSSILDALTAAQLGAGLGVPISVQLCACDVNDDGTLSILDALIMAQFAAGLPVTLTCPMNPCGNTAPTVTITSPTGGTQSGTVVVTLDADDMEMNPLDLSFHFSTDSGATFALATTGGGGSLSSNPAPGVAVPVAAGTFEWDTITDGVGTAMIDTVDFRATADDALLTATSTATFDVDNTGPCVRLICGTTTGGMVGPGTGGLYPALFDLTPGTGDGVPFLVDVSMRPPGSTLTITLTNMSDNCDLYIMDPPGPMCGDPGGGLYREADSLLLVATIPEAEVMNDADLMAYANMVPIVVYHYDPSPSATFDVRIECQVPAVCSPGAGGAGTCASPFLFPAVGGCQNGTTAGASAFQGASCGFGGDGGTGPEHIYSWTPAGNGVAMATVCNPGSTIADSMLSVRQVNCAGAEIACNDDFCGLRSTVMFSYVAGTTYVVIVDGYGGSAGFYELTIIP